MSWNVLAVGDDYLPGRQMREGLRALADSVDLQVIDVDGSVRRALPVIAEHQGDPAQIAAAADGTDVLLVHAAPVTAELLDARPGIRIVACARGNPINVDVAAAAERGVTVLHTPGKNADAVADLTLTFLQMLFRGLLPALLSQRVAAEDAQATLDSTFAGARWMAREPRGSTLGLIGYGAIGRRVAALAEASGMHVLAYDPHADSGPLASLEEVLERSDAVSLHARATPQTRAILRAQTFRRMKKGMLLVNTARPSLVCEDDLLTAIEDGTVRAAALDVCEPEGRWRELALHPRVLVTPHVGGATVQAQRNALDMLTADLLRLRDGRAPLHAVAATSGHA